MCLLFGPGRRGGEGGAGGGGRVMELCFFCCLGGWRVCCLGCLGVFFAVWAGGEFMFLLFGQVACFFLLFGPGAGVHSLTSLPGSSVRGPTTKRPSSNKNTGAVQSLEVPRWNIPKDGESNGTENGK